MADVALGTRAVRQVDDTSTSIQPLHSFLQTFLPYSTNMAFRTLAATAAFALAAEAFMIPSTISLPGVEVDGEGEFRALRMPDALPEQLKNLHMGVSQAHQDTAVTKVSLECPGCSFKGPADAPVDWVPENDLVGSFVCGYIVCGG